MLCRILFVVFVCTHIQVYPWCRRCILSHHRRACIANQIIVSALYVRHLPANCKIKWCSKDTQILYLLLKPAHSRDCVCLTHLHMIWGFGIWPSFEFRNCQYRQSSCGTMNTQPTFSPSRKAVSLQCWPIENNKTFDSIEITQY